jgi:Protein of unknown function (DUF3237)
MSGPSLMRQTGSLLERPERPLPSGFVDPGERPLVSVGAEPPHQGQSVLVAVRPEGCPVEFLRVVPDPGVGSRQWFRTWLPAVEAGHSLDYRVELVSTGRLVATLPSDGSWLTVTGKTPPDASPAETEKSPPGGPFWAYELEYIGSVSVDFRQEVIGATPDGYHVNFFIEGGRVVGPRIDAAIRSEGADWLWVRRDGVALIDVRATWESSEGALISYRSGGVIELGPDGYTKLAAGELAGNPPFCCTIHLLTAHPRYEWVNRLQLLGFGRVDMDRLEISYDVYTPEVKDRRRHA